MRYTKLVLAGVITATLVVGLQISAQDDLATDIDMQQKLRYSQNILAGLVSEDYDKIVENANGLNLLAVKKWTENESMQYRKQNQVFWFTAGNVVLAAKDKNLDGATLAYTQMTISCVNCHKLLRRE